MWSLSVPRSSKSRLGHDWTHIDIVTPGVLESQLGCQSRSWWMLRERSQHLEMQGPQMLVFMGGWTQLWHLLLGYLWGNPACLSLGLEGVIFLGSLRLQSQGRKVPKNSHPFSAFEVQKRFLNALKIKLVVIKCF